MNERRRYFDLSVSPGGSAIAARFPSILPPLVKEAVVLLWFSLGVPRTDVIAGLRFRPRVTIVSKIPEVRES